MAMVGETVTGGVRVEIWDDFAACRGNVDYERVRAEQLDCAARIVRNAARRGLRREDYDMGCVPLERRGDFDDSGCRVRNR